MSIGVTTVSFNAERTIERCIKSVAGQTLLPDKYLVIDGGSSDGTIHILKRYQEKGVISHFIAEPDRGISHAFNKAWNMIDCEYVCNLNADDHMSPDYLRKAQKLIEDKSPDIIMNSLLFQTPTKDRLITPRYPDSWPIKKWQNLRINHPGMIICKSLLKKIGGYDEAYKVAMDIDLFYKALRHSPTIIHLESEFTFQQGQGVSQRKYALAIYEVMVIEIKHGRNILTAVLAFLYRILKSTVARIIYSSLFKKHRR